MIRDLQVSKDAAGFPIVAWKEDRNLASPEAMRRAPVECRIMKDAKTGTLLFVARGTVRHGAFEEGRPWDRLQGFSKPTADQLYYTRHQLEIRQHFTSKSVGAKLALADSAHVLVAEFIDDTPIHINCADASPVEIDQLHGLLVREFITYRAGDFQWPLNDDRVPTFEPARQDIDKGRKHGFWIEMLGWIVALAIVVGLAAFLFWGLGVFRR